MYGASKCAVCHPGFENFNQDYTCTFDPNWIWGDVPNNCRYDLGECVADRKKREIPIESEWTLENKRRMARAPGGINGN